MKKCLFMAMLLFVADVASFAQSPEDILRYSYFQQQGTARSIAIGGAMGSLGRFSPVGPGMGVDNTGCYDDDRLLVVV